MDELLRRRREEVLTIARRHGVGRLRVFGSAARGGLGPESDVDLLAEAVNNPSPVFPGGLIAELEDLLGRRVEVVEPGGLHQSIRQRVLNEALPL